MLLLEDDGDATLSFLVIVAFVSNEEASFSFAIRSSSFWESFRRVVLVVVVVMMGVVLVIVFVMTFLAAEPSLTFVCVFFFVLDDDLEDWLRRFEVVGVSVFNGMLCVSFSSTSSRSARGKRSKCWK